ncbi:unnamed protein product [Sphagnum balticum]
MDLIQDLDSRNARERTMLRGIDETWNKSQAQHHGFRDGQWNGRWEQAEFDQRNWWGRDHHGHGHGHDHSYGQNFARYGPNYGSDSAGQNLEKYHFNLTNMNARRDDDKAINIKPPSPGPHPN